jgi:hypothetical protein
MKIAHILGGWSQNIGNAFFQLGGLWALQKAAPDAEVVLIGEKPGYPSYWNLRGGNPANSMDVTQYLDVDYIILMGPIFRPETEKIWGPSLERLMANGTRLILLGIGAMQYASDDLQRYQTFLKRYKPFILTSRDSLTCQNLGGLADHAYDGIDMGFFVPEVYAPKSRLQDTRDLAVLNFDMMPEPRITLDDKPFKKGCDYDRQFEFAGLSWKVNFPPLRTYLSDRSRMTMFIEGSLFKGNAVTEIGKYHILRTDHRVHPIYAHKTYRYPNVLVNDTPYPYLDCYRAAELTLSSRVHACVAALAYGNHAMLFSKTPRSKLLERVGMTEIGQRPEKVDLALLDEEKKHLVKFLSGVMK